MPLRTSVLKGRKVHLENAASPVNPDYPENPESRVCLVTKATKATKANPVCQESQVHKDLQV